ncbi:oocyte zinc finger protein XlCOF7.1-like [Planococcus citri]|uniref:oocyte zinc finger protein XlCOF7.1-like n=1 Tax=Planococcus citri TaxID=170843 RepID=UPI0031F73E0F
MGGKRSKFFSAMACFFTNDQKGKPVKKAAPARKTKSDRNHDILTSTNIPFIESKPKRQRIESAKPKTAPEIIDLTTEKTTSLVPIEIHILDESKKTSKIFLQWEVDPLEINDGSSTDHSSSSGTITKTEKISEDDLFGTISLKNEQLVDNSISVENMLVEKQFDEFKNDVTMLKQSICDDVDLSLLPRGSHGAEIISCSDGMMNDIIKETETDIKEKKPKLNKVKSSVKGRKKRDDFHASKIIPMNGLGAYFCSLCEIQLNDLRMVKTHLRKCKRVKPRFTCNLCDKRFQWKTVLNAHLKEHFDDNNLDADVITDQTKPDISIKCEPELDIAKFLDLGKDDHESFNYLEQKLKCNSSTVHSSLIKLITDTDPEKVNLACAYCEECFESQISLVEHCRTHMTDRSFICNICGTVFKSNSSLVYHTRIHFRMIRNRKKKDSVPFIKYILRLHSCKECDKSYVSWSALNQHQRTVHPGTAEHLCETCGKIYASKGHLKQHVNRFCGEKKRTKATKGKFTCKMCDKRFYKDTTLQKHELKAHSLLDERLRTNVG